MKKRKSSAPQQSKVSLVNKAIKAANNGSHKESLRIIRSLCNKETHCGLYFRIQSLISCINVEKSRKHIVRERNLKNAFLCAKKATELCSNSKEFSFFFANLKFKHVKDEVGCKEIIQECLRGLAIQSPYIIDEQWHNILTPEDQIRDKFLKLIEESRFKIGRKVIFYWDGLNTEEKQKFLKVSKQDLLECCDSFSSSSMILSDAFSWVENHNKLSFWTCCGSTFPNKMVFNDHFKRCHEVNLTEIEVLMLPTILDDHLGLVVNYEKWKPLDLSAAFRILEKEDSLSCVGTISSIAKILTSKEKLLLSNDFERELKLKEVRLVLIQLFEKKRLAVEHWNIVSNYCTRKVLRLLTSSADHINLDQTLLFLRLLSVSELNKMLRYFTELEEYVTSFSDIQNTVAGIDSSIWGLTNMERTYIIGDSLFFSLDKTDAGCSTGYNSPTDDKSDIHVDHEDRVPCNYEACIRCIVTTSTDENHFDSWLNSRKKRDCLRTNLCLELKNQHTLLKSLCQEKKVELDIMRDLHFQSSKHINDKVHMSELKEQFKTRMLELSRKDARILQIKSDTKTLELQIEALATDDYTAALSPLMKKCIQARLKKAAEQHTGKTFEAATDAPDAFGSKLGANKQGVIQSTASQVFNKQEEAPSEEINENSTDVNPGKVWRNLARDLLTWLFKWIMR